MSDTANFFTQATNFTSAVSSGVDPRTGLFNAHVTLGHLIGNYNHGPSLPLTLSYSPLTTVDIGFGQGFSLGLSIYDSDSHLLVLSTGEQYKVLENNSGVFLQQQKLKNIRFEKDTRNDCYRVIHKSGEVEILTGPKNAYSLKVPVKLLTPAGYALTLRWDYSRGQQPRLSAIQDAYDTLLSVKYDGDTKTTVQLLPGQKEGYDTELWFQNGLLGSIHNFSLEGSPLVWQFNYDTMGYNGEWGLWLTRMTVPGGMNQTVRYRNDGQGHHFPDSAHLPPLPFVTLFTQTPGGGQPEIKTTYTYSDNNFIGGHSGVDWDSQQDNVYAILTDYSYWSEESSTCNGQTKICKRTYNNYHLQVEEKTSQNSCTHKTTIEYYAVIGQNFDRQPPQFQLPKTSTTTWEDKTGSRSEITRTVFDDSGNPVSNMTLNGKTQAQIREKIEWEYYPATGSGNDCPPDPNGFTRFMKTMTTTPAPSNYTSPLQKTIYRYRQYNNPPSSTIITSVLKTSESHYLGNQLIGQNSYEYVDNKDKNEFGRLKTVSNTHYPNGEMYSAYTEKHDFNFRVEGNQLIQTHTITSFDKLQLTRRETRSRFTGRLWSSTNAQNVTSTAAYDKLGRVISSTISQGTSYEDIRNYQYEQYQNGAIPFLVTLTDSNQNQLRYGLDGAGRKIKLDTKLNAQKSVWQTLQKQDYDELGRERTVTLLDYNELTQSGIESAVTQVSQTNSYDDWGQNNIVSSTDGTQQYNLTDPVALTVTTFNSGKNNNRTGKTVTTYNSDHQPITIALYNNNNVLYSQSAMEWDGRHQLRKQTDELGRVTTYEYDNWGRVTKTTLPDNAVITKKYCDYSPENLPVEIAVNNVILGTQGFDGLGRLLTTSSGGRTWQYSYDLSTDIYPTTEITPLGQKRQRLYIAALENALASVSTSEISQNFQYNSNGSVNAASEKNTNTGNNVLSYQYYPSGRLSNENLDGKPTNYAYTTANRLKTYTHVDGAVQTITPDTFGRITAIADKDMQVTVKYDDLGRLYYWKGIDLKSKKTLSTTVKFDDFGREISRNIKGEEDWSINQYWNKNHQINNKETLLNSVSVRNEIYGYDNRNRLITYSCTGTQAPTDNYGNVIRHQTFSYDVYGNIQTCTSNFADNSTNVTTYVYGNTKDPCQLTSVKHTHPRYPSGLLKYDTSGQLTQDEQNRNLSYDQLGRLFSVKDSNGTKTNYTYDPLNRLKGQGTTSLYYRGNQLINIIESDNSTRLLNTDTGCCAQYKTGKKAGVWLTGTDSMNSVITVENNGDKENYTYAAYGESLSTARGVSVLGFNGERKDTVLNAYQLGNGYRAYSPSLRRFTSPDSLSPFGAGGINAYAYCLGDPINLADPSGHLSWQAGLGIGLGILGLGLAIITGGIAIAAAGGVMAAISAASVTSLAVGALGVASDVTAIVSGALEEVSPQASSILGWVSLGTGVIGLGVSVAKAGAKAVGKLDALSERVATIQQEGLGGKGAVNAMHEVVITDVDPKNVLFSQNSISSKFSERAHIPASWEGQDVAGLWEVLKPSEGNHVGDLIEEIREFPLTYYKEVPPIRTVKVSDLSQFPKVREKFPNNTHPNSLITIDNRRLYAARRAGISEILSQPATHDELKKAIRQCKFTTINGGKSVNLRVKN